MYDEDDKSSWQKEQRRKSIFINGIVDILFIAFCEDFEIDLIVRLFSAWKLVCNILISVARRYRCGIIKKKKKKDYSLRKEKKTIEGGI